jgi:hypothetical protein
MRIEHKSSCYPEINTRKRELCASYNQLAIICQHKKNTNELNKIETMKKILFILLIILIGCSENESVESLDENILGIYQVESFKSIEIADLDSDGISSDNFKSELIEFFDETPLKISELPEYDPFDLLFSIHLPYPNEIVDKPYGYLIYDLYALFKRLDYQNGELYIHENDINFEDKITFQSFKIIESSKILIKLDMKLYDFETLMWKNYDCEILYARIE